MSPPRVINWNHERMGPRSAYRRFRRHGPAIIRELLKFGTLHGMSSHHRIARLLCVPLAFCLLGSECEGNQRCPKVTSTLLDASVAEFAWTIDGASHESSLAAGAPIACTAQGQFDFKGSTGTSADQELTTTFVLHCGDAAGADWVHWSLRVQDLRDAPLGEIAAEDITVDRLTADYPDTCPAGESCPICRGRPELTPVLTVVQAAGESAPYPELLSNHFKHTFEVRLVAAEPTAGRRGYEPDSPLCERVLDSFSVQTTVTLTRQTLSFDPDGSCQ